MRCDARCVPPPRPWHACSLCARAPRVPRRILPAPSDAHRGPCMTQTHSTDPPSHLHRLSVCRTTPPTAAASRSSRARTARPTCTRGATASSCSRARRTSTCGCAPAGTRRLGRGARSFDYGISQINLLHHTNPTACSPGECMCSPGECSTPTHITTRTPPLLPPPPCCARNNSGDAVIFDNRLLHRGCRKSQANLRHRARLDADPVARPGVAAVPKARPIWPTNRGRLHAADWPRRAEAWGLPWV